MLNPISRYLMIAKLVAILALAAWGLRVNDLRARWHHQYTAEHQGRLQDRATYTQAQKDAAANNAAQVQRVKAEQQRITTNAEQSYEADLARLRADLAKRLRQGTTTAQGSAGNAGSPDLPNPAAAPGETGSVCISPEAYVSGAETELQLERLEEWLAEQLKVDPNK